MESAGIIPTVPTAMGVVAARRLLPGLELARLRPGGSGIRAAITRHAPRVCNILGPGR